MKEKTMISSGKKIMIAIIATMVVLILFFGGWMWWRVKNTVYFQDVTVELGEQLPELAAFIREGKKPIKPQMVTPAADIDLTKTGEQTLEFATIAGSQTVKLFIVDTTAPKVIFRDSFANWDDKLEPADFIQEITDLSTTTVAFVEEPVRSETSSEATVKLVVTDAHGNETKGECIVSFTWMYREITLELGKPLTKDLLLVNPEQDSALLDQAELDKIDTLVEGTHTIVSTKGDRSCQCVITIKDTVAPELKLKDVTLYSGEKVTLEQFIARASDVSGDVTVVYEQEPDTQKVGDFTVTIIATDVHGNQTTASATLHVIRDQVKPTFSGMSDITVKKGKQPDYEKGVKAVDDRDGTVKFTYDASKVDVNKAGTYYVVYSATDNSGNKATYRRRVTVDHGPDDTAALVKETAAKLSDDPVAISKWIRDNVPYYASWGGDDPVWYGLKNKRGNCLVHAKLLEALLREKGYETQLIWVTEIQDGRPTHYWNLVKVNGVWRHIDATPGVKHPSYLMTDQQRYNNLQGRDWDRTKWPKCE